MTVKHRRVCVKWDLAFKADLKINQYYFMDLCQFETAVTKRSFQMRLLNYCTAELEKQQQSFMVSWVVCVRTGAKYVL